MFYVGQKVVCIDNKPYSFHFWGGKIDIPKINQIYTIKRPEYVYSNGVIVVDLKELNNPAGYRAFRFRPLVEKKTDISIFTDILNTIKELELV